MSKTGNCSVCERRYPIQDGVLAPHRPQGKLRPCEGGGKPPRGGRGKYQPRADGPAAPVMSRLSPRILTRVMAYCEAHDVNRAEAMRRLVKAGLDAWKPEAPLRVAAPAPVWDRRAGPMGEPPPMTVQLPVPDPFAVDDSIRYGPHAPYSVKCSRCKQPSGHYCVVIPRAWAGPPPTRWKRKDRPHAARHRRARLPPRGGLVETPT